MNANYPQKSNVLGSATSIKLETNWVFFTDFDIN